MAQPANKAPAAAGGGATAAWQHFAAQAHAALGALLEVGPGELPPAPPGVTDLGFGEFFGPIGDRGLEYSKKIRTLDGARVRLVGHMVREAVHAPGLFLFAGWPVSFEAKAACSVDDPPPSVVHVLVPASADRPVPFRPGRLVLLGRLELGPRLEADGRNSVVRLILDARSAGQLLPAPATPPNPDRLP
jgi:hypothetical protein